MDKFRIIAGTGLGIIASLCIIYVLFTIRGKGPIFPKKHLKKSIEGRKNKNNKLEYKFITTIFSGLAATFLFLTVYIFTYGILSYILVWISITFVIVCAIIYVAKESIDF